MAASTKTLDGAAMKRSQKTRRRGFRSASLPTVLVGIGEDATLHCPLLDDSNGTSDSADPATLSWYRKAAGRGPTLLLSLRPGNGSVVRYGDGVGPQKVSAAANGSLVLRGTELSDSAVYYCGVSHGSDQNKNPTPNRSSGLIGSEPDDLSSAATNVSMAGRRPLTSRAGAI